MNGWCFPPGVPRLVEGHIQHIPRTEGKSPNNWRVQPPHLAHVLQYQYVHVEHDHPSMKLEAREGHQRKMDEAALYASDDGTGSFEEHIARELEHFGFTGFRMEISPFARDEGAELLKIDIASEKERVALELDGPFHFLKSIEEKGEGEDPRRDGLTKAKTRLMESLGWKVIRFSWLKRTELDKRPEQERREFWFKEPGGFGVVPSK